MVESVIAMIVILLVFLALFNLADLIRAKLLVENAAVKCARARAVGYNDFQLRKIARLATMPVAGECLTAADSGNGKPSYSARIHRISDYLSKWRHLRFGLSHAVPRHRHRHPAPSAVLQA